MWHLNFIPPPFTGLLVARSKVVLVTGEPCYEGRFQITLNDIRGQLKKMKYAERGRLRVTERERERESGGGGERERESNNERDWERRK
jgi:hypothetical protein